jgi:DNA (cytosine-5)-methyltransferase 1
MIYGSVCSGIEAASLGWHPLGWQPAWFSELNQFCNAVLAVRWPGVHNFGDMTTIRGQYDAVRDQLPVCGGRPGGIDLLVGGTPCQSFSVAGLGGGLDDPRGDLALEFLRLARHLRPRWVLWENVPGILSRHPAAFGQFLWMLGQCGYGFAYRVLDAKHFGVPQNRRRVFVVGCLGNWRAAGAVLFESSSLQIHAQARREPRPANPRIAQTNTDRSSESGDGAEIYPALTAAGASGTSWVETQYLVREHCGTLSAGRGSHTEHDRGAFIPVEDGIPMAAGTLGSGSEGSGWRDDFERSGAFIPEEQVAFGGGNTSRAIEIATACNAKGGSGRQDFHTETFIVRRGRRRVRRLTPREWERLQGFPDDYTLVPYNGQPAKDGPRYRAIGNSMAVPVMAWLGRRIDMANTLLDHD